MIPAKAGALRARRCGRRRPVDEGRRGSQVFRLRFGSRFLVQLSFYRSHTHVQGFEYCRIVGRLPHRLRVHAGTAVRVTPELPPQLRQQQRQWVQFERRVGLSVGIPGGLFVRVSIGIRQRLQFLLRLQFQFEQSVLGLRPSIPRFRGFGTLPRFRGLRRIGVRFHQGGGRGREGRPLSRARRNLPTRPDHPGTKRPARPFPPDHDGPALTQRRCSS